MFLKLIDYHIKKSISEKGIKHKGIIVQRNITRAQTNDVGLVLKFRGGRAKDIEFSSPMILCF